MDLETAMGMKTRIIKPNPTRSSPARKGVVRRQLLHPHPLLSRQPIFVFEIYAVGERDLSG
jgi:hypothetical protein